MPTTYSTSLRLSLIATGELAGTWSTVTNSNLGTLLEQAITGVVDIVMVDANYTLTATNAASDEARNALLRVYSSVTLTATRQIIIPNVKKIYIIANLTTGVQSIRVQTATPTLYVDIPQGYVAVVGCDGAAVVAQATVFYNPATNGIFASAVTATTLTAGSVAATITPIAATSGGTGLATYTTGDTLYASAANTLSKLPIGTAGQTLTVAAGIPSWTTVTASGDVVGPASATDNAVARFDLATGKLIQNSAVTIADTTGDIVGTATQGVFNTVSTTVNAFGAATTLNVGAATGTMTLGNTTLAAKAITASTTLGVTGVSTFGAAVVGAASQDVFNTISTTVNAFGAATALNVGAATGTLTVANTTLAAKAITATTTLDVTGVATFSNAMNAAQGADIASAATVNLTTATGNSVHITGTTTITAITLAQGAQRDVTFDGILTLTQGASLLLPPGASIITAAGDTASFVGEAASVVRCTSYTRAAAPALGSSPQLGVPSNLKILANAGLATTAVTCNEITVSTSGGFYATLRTVSVTINSGTAGANGLDTGTVAANTWYSVWVIYNGTTTAGLMSISATAPTLPSGYTYKARVGYIRTSATAAANIGSIQYGSNAQYIVDGTTLTGMRQIAAGSIGSTTVPTYVATAWATFAPPSTSQIVLVLSGTNSTNGDCIIAPNGNYGLGSSATNPPVGKLWSMTNGGGAIQTILTPESSNVYLATESAARIYVLGWADNL